MHAFFIRFPFTYAFSILLHAYELAFSLFCLTLPYVAVIFSFFFFPPAGQSYLLGNFPDHISSLLDFRSLHRLCPVGPWIFSLLISSLVLMRVGRVSLVT